MPQVRPNIHGEYNEWNCIDCHKQEGPSLTSLYKELPFLVLDCGVPISAALYCEF